MNQSIYPLFVQILTINGIFLCGLLYPVYRMTGVMYLVIFLVAVNIASFLGLRWWFVSIGNAIFRSSTGKNIVLTVSSIIIFIGGVEYLARGLTELDILDYSSGMKTMLPEGTEDWRLAHITADRYREPDPVLFWRPINRRPYNSQRFKGPEVAVPKPPGTFRIICYGDSNTDGPKQGGWPEQIQTILDQRSNHEKLKYEVLNAGVTGYSSYQGLLRFKSEVKRYQPDLVMVSFGWNDLPAALGAPDKFFQPPHVVITGIKRILLRYRFYRVTKHYIRWPVSVKDMNLGHRVSIQDYVLNMKDFLNTANENGAKIVFLTRPFRTTRLDWHQKASLYNKELLAFGKQNNALVINIQEIFNKSYPDMFVDECHFSLEGHKKMALILYSELLDSH